MFCIWNWKCVLEPEPIHEPKLGPQLETLQEHSQKPCDQIKYISKRTVTGAVISGK